MYSAVRGMFRKKLALQIFYGLYFSELDVVAASVKNFVHKLIYAKSLKNPFFILKIFYFFRNRQVRSVHKRQGAEDLSLQIFV